MKILHSSDWHLGRALYGRKRYSEFEDFLNWLTTSIQQHNIDALLIAGDIFDTSTPSHFSQKLYYQFLCRIAASTCRHVVIIAGNHDSPTFLSAPKELLKALNVYVIGSPSVNIDDEVLVLRDNSGIPELIICAVPYLRDRDIRIAEAGESVDDKERKLQEGIRRHYAEIAASAEKTREQLGSQVPIVGMGHLFTAGGKTLEDDGVRDLYVGSLAHVNASIFPSTFDYVALGHLHVPQKVGGFEHIRYCGSPLPMGFGEANQQKKMCEIHFSIDASSLKIETTVHLIDVPVFQKLKRIRGDWPTISKQLMELTTSNAQAWLEIVYDGDDVIGDLRFRLDTAIHGSAIEILRVKNTRIIERVLGKSQERETLDDLNVHEVFESCLNAHEVAEQQRSELRLAYQETLASLYEDDPRAE